MLDEICRLVVSLCLIGFCAFLYWLGFHSADVADKLGATNVASAVIGAMSAYWLKPRSPTEM